MILINDILNTISDIVNSIIDSTNSIIFFALIRKQWYHNYNIKISVNDRN